VVKMKKLLVLLLFMGIASLTSADLIITGADVDVYPGDSLTIGISSDGINSPLTDVYKLIITGQQAENLAGAAINYPDNSSDPSAIYSGGAGIVYIDFSTGLIPAPIWADPDENTPVASGIFLTNIAAPLTLELTDYYGSTFDAATVGIIPEPATMVLLGAGILGLRRRR
jgi:hypothetical protein